MLEKLKQTLSSLEKTEDFNDYKKKHKDSYLTSCFFMASFDAIDKTEWQMDFYSPKNHKLTTFKLVDKKLIVEPDQGVFQEKKVQLEKVELERVKIDFDKLLSMVNDVVKNNYKEETPIKLIVVLQNNADKMSWNVTFITSSFKVLNVKINAEDGKVLEHKLEPIFTFKKDQAANSS